MDDPLSLHDRKELEWWRDLQAKLDHRLPIGMPLLGHRLAVVVLDEDGNPIRRLERTH